MPQVPAEKRIKVADTLRLFFHFFNILNLTLGLIICGVGVSLIASPLPLDISEQISLVYGVLLVTAIVVILMGLLGVHGCYRVQDTGLKIYALVVFVALILEVFLGTLTLVKRVEIEGAIDTAVNKFRMNGLNESAVQLNGSEMEKIRLAMYHGEDSSYKHQVDLVHEQMACCSFTDSITVKSCYFSLYHKLNNIQYDECSYSYKEYINARLDYMRYLCFILLPVQVACLVFDLLVLKTLKVTKDYEKLERELSNRRRLGSQAANLESRRESTEA